MYQRGQKYQRKFPRWRHRSGAENSEDELQSLTVIKLKKWRRHLRRSDICRMGRKQVIERQETSSAIVCSWGEIRWDRTASPPHMLDVLKHLPLNERRLSCYVIARHHTAQVWGVSRLERWHGCWPESCNILECPPKTVSVRTWRHQNRLKCANMITSSHNIKI